MDAFVLDVSACMPWCCEDETTAASEEMLEWAMDGSVLHVPSLWVWEILNTVAVVTKRRRITADRGREFLEQLAALNFKVDGPPPIADFPRLRSLASDHQLTAYDVAYLDLAMRLSLPLATRDDDFEPGRTCRGCPGSLIPKAIVRPASATLPLLPSKQTIPDTVGSPPGLVRLPGLANRFAPPLQIGLQLGRVPQVESNNLINVCQRNRWILLHDLFRSRAFSKRGKYGFQCHSRATHAHDPVRADYERYWIGP